MLRYALIIAVVGFSCIFLQAQTPEDNLAKYWQYRNLLKKQFVFVGEKPGESIPFATYEPNRDISWDGVWNSQLDCYPVPYGNGGLTTGDATLQIGIYLAVLATEYALIKPLGYETSGIEREIYHAIKAFARLDEGAEAYFGNPGKNDPSFFLRDDIPFGFEKDSLGKNRIPNLLAANPQDSFIHVVKGDFTCANLSNENKYPGVTSQDQVAHLSIGFTLIQKFLDEEATYNGVKLKEYGKNVYKNLYDGFKANNFVAGKPKQLPETWRVDYRSLIQAGYPFKRVINTFFGGNEFNPSTDRNLWLDIFLPGYLLNADKPYNAAMGFIWGALGDAVNSINWLALQTKNRHLEVYALLHALLHNKNVGDALPQSHFENLLNVAPCNIPCAYEPSGCPTPDNADWNAGYRWTNNNRNSNQDWQRGFFNGIDYMLLYNLYHLEYNPEVAYYPSSPPPCDFYNQIAFDSIPKKTISTGVLNPSINFNLEVFPNPASKVLQISMNDLMEEESSQVILKYYTTSGKLVATRQKIINSSILVDDISDFVPQFYVLLIQHGDNVYGAKFVKN